jgi:hypothetical protein
MTSNTRDTLWSALWMLIVIAAAMSASFWVKQHHPASARFLGPAIAIAVMACALLLARRQQRHLDEVQFAGMGFAAGKAYGLGAMATMLLLMLPPFTDWLIGFASTQTHSMDTDTRRAVRTALLYGASLMVFVQLLVYFAASCIWWRRMK